MSGPFSVDTIHLNIGIGDCSIVCKTKKPTSSSSGSTPKDILVSAVLIDGGYQSAAGIIEKCIKEQLNGTDNNKGLYDLSEMEDKAVKFDSVVITHWDEDHWGGPMNLICADLKKQLREKIDPEVEKALKAAGTSLTKNQSAKIKAETEKKIAEANTATKKTAQGPIQLRCPYFKYDPTNGRPLTTLYVPYWEAIAGAGKPKAFMNKSNRLGTDFGAVFDVDIGSSEGTAERWVLNLCRLSYTYQMNLGKSILKPLNLSDPLITSDIDGPINLAKFLDLEEGATPEPALVIVACDRHGVWGDTPPTSSTLIQRKIGISPTKVATGRLKPHGNEKIVDIHLPAKPSPAQKTNQASIACLILWGNGHVSHYLAGDSYSDQETPLINFIRNKSVAKERIGAVKLSHHGAQSSSPTDLFTALEPKNVIVSAGTMHGHPRWELILWLDLYNRQSRSDRYICLAPTIYPYWMLPAKPTATKASPEPPFVNHLRISIQNLYGPSAAGTPLGVYQAEIKEMVDEIKEQVDKDPSNIFAPDAYEFKFQKATKDLAVIGGQRRMIWDLMPAAMENISPVGQEMASFGRTDDPEDIVSFWRVQSTSDLDTDGATTGQRVNYDIETLNSIPGSATHHEEEKQEVAPRSFKTRAGARYRAATNGLLPGLKPGEIKTLAKVELNANKDHEGEGDEGETDVPLRLKRGKKTDTKVEIVNKLATVPAANPSNPTVKPLALPTDDYFICASTILVTSGTNALILQPNETGTRGALDVFLDGLSTGMLALQSAPDSTGSALLSATADFPDSLFRWMNASLNANSVLVQGTPNSSNSQSTSPVTGFVVSINDPLRLDTSTSTATTHPYAMQFSTAAFVPDPSIQPAPAMPFGFEPLANLLTMGLDLASTNTALHSINLADLLTFIGMNQSHLQTLGGAINLTLDRTSAARNTLWFMNQPSYKSVMRLQFTLTDETTFTTFVSKISPNLMLSNIRLIARKRVTKFIAKGGFNAIEKPQMIVTVTLTPQNLTAMDAAFIFEFNVITLVIQPQNGTLDQMLGWLAFLTPGASQTDVQDVQNWVAKVAPKGTPIIREMRLAISQGALQMFFLDLEVDVDFGKSLDGSGKVAFFFTYCYNIGTPHHKVTGYLYKPDFPVFLDQVDQRLLPDFEPYNLLPKPSDTYAEFLYASNILGDLHITNVPQELDLEITALRFSLDSDQFSFLGSMSADPAKTSNASHFALDLVRISATWVFATKDASGNPVDAQYDVSLSTEVLLEAANPDDNAVLAVSVAYNSPTWDLSASVYDLKMSALVSLFPKTDGSTVMDVMDHFEIINFLMDYQYDTSGTGGSFSVKASLLLNIFVLDFSFNWTKASAAWDIFATLTLAPTVHTTLVAVLQAALKDQTITDLIPGFANFDIDGGSSNVELVVKKGINPKDNTEAVVFAISLLIKGGNDEPDIRISFTQIKRLAGTGSTTTSPPSIKRILRISVNSIPWGAVPNIPMVGSLKQPFNEIDYAWVHDDGTGDSTTLGLTRADIECIKDAVSARDSSLVPPVKDLVPLAKQIPGDILLPHGSHFLVIADDPSLAGGTGVVLDYLCRSSSDSTVKGDSGGGAQSQTEHLNAKAGFATQPAVIGSDSASTKTLVVRDASTTPGDSEPEGEAAMGKHTNTQGPLSISNVGLRYSNGVLSLLFDATVKLGPLEFSLIGFGIGIDLSGLNLRSLLGATPKLSLKGLAAEYNEPPLAITGLFENLSSPGIVKYVGGISVAFEPYDFLAVGAYGEITNNNHTYKSVFIFAKLEGPLVEFEFAEISGICGGFGYNSYVRYPSLAELYSFPFVDHPAAGDLAKSDPLVILESFTSTDPSNPNKGWVSDQEGSIWLAAGLKVTAFQTLSINAVIVLEFNPYVSLGIFADAVASLPASTDGSKSPIYILYVELGILATVDFHGGTFRVEASLSPNSYVLNPLCHLSGGFALCYWFAGSAFEGDWVFTVGGYHAAFSPPDHYPTPDRLQIYWGLGGGLSVTGEAYLAITPKVCMMGGLLKAVLDAGPLGAYFDAHADLLITYKPFHFKGTAGVEIGVSFTLDLFICTLHISVDISAELSLYGPPFGGDVWVDFWVFGFSIHFGDDENTQHALDIIEFNTLLMQQHNPTTAVATATTTVAAAAPTPGASVPTPAPAPAPVPSTNDHVFAIEKGRYIVNKSTNNTETPEGAIWMVKPQGFVFRVQSRFAIETSSCNGVTGVSTGTPIYAKPMQLVANTKDPTLDQHITSTMTVKISETVHGAVTKEVQITAFKIDAVIKKVPQALWGPYNTAEDPLLQGNQIGTLMDSKSNLTVDLIMGLTLTAPPPQLSHDLIKPFDAKDSMAQDIFTDDDGKNGLNPALDAKPVFAQPDWNPVAHPAGVKDTDEQLWTTAKTAWQNPQDLGAGLDGKTWGLADVADMWKSAMQWKEGVAPTFPTSFVTDIETYYMSAPFVGS